MNEAVAKAINIAVVGNAAKLNEPSDEQLTLSDHNQYLWDMGLIGRISLSTKEIQYLVQAQTAREKLTAFEFKNERERLKYAEKVIKWNRIEYEGYKRLTEIEMNMEQMRQEEER